MGQAVELIGTFFCEIHGFRPASTLEFPTARRHRQEFACDFGSAPKTGRQPMAATATLLEQNLQLRPAPAPPRRSSRIEGLPPQNFKEPDGRKNPGVGGADREDLTCFL